MVEPHCKTGHGDRNNNYLLVSTVVIVPNSVCVFSKPLLALSVLLVCGLLPWNTLGFC